MVKSLTKENTMKHTHFGLRMKLILAFLVIAVLPQLIAMLISFRDGLRLEKEIATFQTENKEMLTRLGEYEAQHQVTKDEVFVRLKETFPSADQATLSGALQYLNSFDEEDNHLKTIFRELQAKNQQALDTFAALVSKRSGFFLWFIIAMMAVSAVFAFILGRSVMRPITQLTGIARKIAQGEIAQRIDVHTRDEIGQLRDAFQAMNVYIQDMAQVANHIANGNIKQTFPPKSAKDVLGNAFQTMGQYLNTIAQIANQIANGDLGCEIVVKSPDDVLGNAFRKMTTNLAEIIQKIKGEVRTVEQASDTTATRSAQELKMVEEVLSSTEETSASMTEMQASVEEVSENMKALTTSVEESVTAIEQMNMSMQHIAANSQGLSDSATETFGVIQEIGESIKRLVATSQQAESSSKEASESANAGQVSVRAIMEGMATIQHVVSTSADMIKALGSRSEAIGSITNVISEIADQTSLLALNASIIAAQAGEHGRGFAVVAQEVKELAQRSDGAAKEIGDLIRGVQTESQKAVQSMAGGLQAVAHGVVLANRGGEALETILKSVGKALESIADNTRTANEQARLSEQVRQYMENVVKMVDEIVRATGEQQQGSAQITEAVERMRDFAEQVKRATTEQTKGTTHVMEAMDNVTVRVQESATRAHETTQFSAELAKEAHTLMGLLNQFRIGD
jgi:methyl-accepting chemotaxis protein